MYFHEVWSVTSDGQFQCPKLYVQAAHHSWNDQGGDDTWNDICQVDVEIQGDAVIWLTRMPAPRTVKGARMFLQKKNPHFTLKCGLP